MLNFFIIDALGCSDLLQKLLQLTRGLGIINRSETFSIVNIVQFLLSIFNHRRELGLEVSTGDVSGLYHA